MRLNNPSNMYEHSTNSCLLEREDLIHQDLVEERRKYIAMKNTRKNKMEKVMPVTHVITHVRRMDEQRRPDDGIHGINEGLIDDTDIAIQGRMLPIQTSESRKLPQNSRNPGDRREVIKDREEMDNSSTCKCCGIGLSFQNSKSNTCKPQCSSSSYLERYLYVKPKSFSLCVGPDMPEIVSNQPGKDNRNEIQKIGMKRGFAFQTDDDVVVEEVDNGGIPESNTLDDVNFSHKTYDSTLNMLTKAQDEIYTDWKDEARNALLAIGTNVKIVNGVRQRHNNRIDKLVYWSFCRWKRFVENNKDRREKLQRLKFRRKMDLVRQCFQTWKGKANKTKEKAERNEKIDTFLNVLRTKQLELKKEEEEVTKTKKLNKYVESKNEFKNRLNAQRNMILLQKKKLLQAEEDMREIKLKQILEQSKVSRQAVVENVKETIRDIDPMLKVTAQQIMRLEVKPKQNDKAKILVENMEKRAKERKQKWQVIQERKKQKAEEAMKMLQEQEAKRVKQEEEKKRQIMEEQREKRRIEREQATQRENERRRLNSLTIIADNFHKKKLMQKSFRALREHLRNNLIKMDIAEKFYIYKVKRRFFFEWKFYTEVILAEKMRLAACFYDYLLKRRVFDSFKQIYNERVRSLQVAMDFRELKIQEKYFTRWTNFVGFRRKMFAIQMREAGEYYNRNLLQSSFRHWRQLPEICFDEREKEKRLREWRDKVKEVLPDFVPFDVE